MNDDSNVSTSKPCDDIVLLAGAGASSYLELPALDDLLSQAHLGNDDVADRIRRTRDVIQSEPDRYRIAVFEELIARLIYYLDIAIRLRTDFVFRQELGLLSHDVDNRIFEQKWKNALTRCYQILIEEYGPKKINSNSEEFRTTLKLLEELAKLNSGELHIYTTNYDCSYQVLASNCKSMSFRTHISNNNGNFTDSWYYANHDTESSNLPSVYIHRLHGCVAWFTVSGVTREEFGTETELTIPHGDNLLNIKLVASKLIGENPVLSSAFEEFTIQLQKAKILFVWGYSFRDLEVLRVINNTFSIQNDLKICYLDPYLPINQVVNNIQRALLSAPILYAPQFRNLVRVNWIPQDGHEKLIEVVIETLRKELNNVKR